MERPVRSNDGKDGGLGGGYIGWGYYSFFGSFNYLTYYSRTSLSGYYFDIKCI